MLITTIFLLASCKSAPVFQGLLQPFGIIGDEADIYVFMPIEENRTIVEQVLPMASGKDVKKALGRTVAVYSGIFLYPEGAEVRICTKGQYPYGLTDMFFKKKNGWEPKKTNDGYKYYESDYVDISIPSPLIACIGLGSKNRQKMDVGLNRLKKPVEPKFSEKFNSVLNSKTQEMAIYIKKADYFLSGILGMNLGMPLGKIEMYLKKDMTNTAEKDYIYTLYIESKNQNTAKIAKFILQRMFKAEVKIQDNYLIIENGKIPENKIISIIKSIYPYK